MNNARKLLMLILLSVILISSVSIVSAADLNSTEVQAIPTEEIDLEQTDSNQDVLSAGNSYSDLNDLINGSTSSEIELDHDYAYNQYSDNKNFLIVEKDNIVIDGNGHTITGSRNTKYPAYGFNVTSENVVIKNIHFVDMGSFSKKQNGGAILTSLGKNLTVINCTFKYCYGDVGGAISNVKTVENCSFDYCSGDLGGAASSCGIIRNSNFTNCNAREGGAVSQCDSVNCNFIDNSAGQGGAGRLSSFINCTFKGNSASYAGAVYQYYSNDVIINCTFIGNQASGTGGALFSSFGKYYVINSTFENNTAHSNAVSILAELVLCTFRNNVADDGVVYESGAIGKPTLYSPVSSYYVTCPDPVVVPIYYAYQWGSGDNDYFKYKGEVYLFNDINTTLELCEGYSSNVIAEYTVLSGSSWIADLNKGTYNLKARSANGDSSKTYYIHVYGEKTSIIAENHTELYVGEDKYLVVNLTGSQNNPLAGLNVSLKENSNVLDVLTTDNRGQVRFSLKNLAQGNHNLYLEFLEDSRHEASSLPVTVLVKKFDTILKADNVTAFIGDDITLTVNLTDCKNNPLIGYLVYLKDNSNVLNVLATNSSGQVSFSLNDLSAGNYNLYVEILENEKYSSSSLPVKVIINKFSTVISTENITAFSVEDINLVVSLTDEENNPMVGYVVYLKENGVVLDNLTTDGAGQVVFSLNDLSAGSHSLYVEFLGDRIYEGSASSAAVLIKRFSTVIKADDIVAFISDDLSLPVNLTDAENSPMVGYVVYLKENGVVLDNLTTDEAGHVLFSLRDLSAGSHSLYVEFLGDRIYEGSISPVTVAIDKYDSVIKAENITAFTYQDINLVVSLTDEENNPMVGYVVYLKENGVVLDNLTTDGAGQVSFSLNDLSAGSHELYVEFMETRFYRGSALQVSAVINKFDSVIMAENITAFTYQDINLVVSLTDEENNPMVGYVVYLKENGVVLDNLTTDGAGQVSFSLNDLSAGSHSLYVEFLESRLYRGSALPVSAVINRLPTAINAGNVTAYVVEDIILMACLTYGENIPIDNCEVYLKDNDGILNVSTTNEVGQVIFSLNGLSTGSHELYVEFLGNRIYEGSVLPVSVVIDKVGTVLKADNVTAFPTEAKIVAKLTDQWGNPLTDSKLYLKLSYMNNRLFTHVGNGVYEFDLNYLASGNFNGKITLNENDTHKGASVDVSVIIFPRLISNIYADNLTVFYDEYGNLTAYLKDSNGNPIADAYIKLTVNAKFKEIKTNSEGRADFDLSPFKLPVASFDAVISVDLTSRYTPSSTHVNITVNRLPTKIIAPNVVGVYGDYFVATLKDKNDNPIPHKEIIVKVNGRTISQGTDDLGRAEYFINLVPGSYPVEIIFEGTNFYDSSSATSTITVNEDDENSGGHYSGNGGNQSGDTPVTNGTSGNGTSGNGGSQAGDTPVTNGTSGSETSGNGGSQKPTETTSNDVAPTEYQDEYLVVTLKDDSGNIVANQYVIIELNGQSKTYKTNGKGQVIIYGEGLVPKTYNAKVTVLGDNKNKVSSFNVKIVVKKAKPKIIAKNKKFKAKKKVKKYAISLKVGKKPVKKVKVTIKIGKKTFKAKTNAKGKAVFKIKKLTKKRTYKAVITFKGNKWYSKVTKKVKITMK